VNAAVVGIVFAAAAAATWAGTALVLRSASKHMLDIPNERSSHVRPTPRGGGAAIAIVVLAGIIWHAIMEAALYPLAPVLAGAVLVAAVGLRDDVRSLSRPVRFAAHVGAAALAIVTFGAFESLVLPGGTVLSLGLAGILLTLLWITGLSNAFNFMDGIDGIAGAQSVVAGGFWAALGLLAGVPQLAVAGALLAGAGTGFLVLNWAPARIFMGDAGSVFLGYAFAVMPLAIAADPRAPWLALLAVAPFVFDATFTFLRRAHRGEDVFAAHRSHLYQRIAIAAGRHDVVAAVYGVTALLSAVGGLYVWVVGAAALGPVLAAVALLLLGLWRCAVVAERRDAGRDERGSAGWRASAEPRAASGSGVRLDGARETVECRDRSP
jgi:Fuc2NAc and GlcNAc transferase